MLRISKEEEEMGLDKFEHGGAAYYIAGFAPESTTFKEKSYKVSEKNQNGNAADNIKKMQG